jgi:hypothetical protein
MGLSTSSDNGTGLSAVPELHGPPGLQLGCRSAGHPSKKDDRKLMFQNGVQL